MVTDISTMQYRHQVSYKAYNEDERHKILYFCMILLDESHSMPHKASPAPAIGGLETFRKQNCDALGEASIMQPTL
jgi:hypothetical protein